MLKVIILAGLVGIAWSSITCDLGELSKVGCLKRNSAVFPDMISNNRDSSSSKFTGEILDWNNYEASLKKLACDCASKAKADGYGTIALGYYGECYGNKDEDAYKTWLENDDSLSNNCIGHDYLECTEGKSCVGEANAEYVYTFPSQAPEKIDGGYGNWSDYTSCSATCGEGFKERERVCNNPIPSDGGADCSGIGESTETASCNIGGCPVNGAYGSWSTYGSCNKDCGSGSHSRTRQCNNPTPAYGGNICSGIASESKGCNTQPCLATASCTEHYTSYNGDGGGNAAFLDRHTLHCPSGKVMSTLVLQRSSSGDQVRYYYKCCKSQLACTDSLKTNGQTANGGGNAIFFDRQTINCNDKGMSYLKLDRSGDNWNYKYDCCKVNYASASKSCYDDNTGFNDDGDGDSNYLDRHTLSCNSNYFITYMKLVRNGGGDKIRYNYRCCKLNTPSVTN